MQRSRSAIKSYRVFGDVSSEFRCIVSEAVVCQLRLVVVVLPLLEERHQSHFALLLDDSSITITSKAVELFLSLAIPNVT